MTAIKRLWLVGLLCCGTVVRAQSGGQQSNPFPEETQQQAKQNAAPSTRQTPPKPGSTANTPNSGGTEQNPFPGEDANAPVIPVGPEGANPALRHATPSPTVSDIDPNGDPVRMPEWNDEVTDPAVEEANQESSRGFSSSTTGMQDWNTPDTPTGKGKHKKGQQEDVQQTPEQRFKEDLSVGSFYEDQRNWVAAESRFAEAFQMNPEEPKALWGLAVAEEHLQEYAKARQHYELYLSYGMDGREAKEARKALKEMPQTDGAQNR